MDILIYTGRQLWVIPGLFLALRLSFMPYLVLDEGLGPVAALKESWRLTGMHVLTILGLWVMSIPILLMGAILLLIGLIPAFIWVSLAQATLFAAVQEDERLKRERVADQPNGMRGGQPI